MTERRAPLLALAVALLAVGPGAPRPLSGRGAAPAFQERARGATPAFTWEAVAGLEPTARRLGPELEEILAEARRWTGLAPSAEPAHLVWVAGREDLARELGQEVASWSAAVTQPARRRLLIATQPAATEQRLRATLRHEILHLAMADLGPPAYERLPAWFHEGCAQVFAGERYLDQFAGALSWRALAGNLEYLSEYRAGFGRETYHAAVGYALSAAFVQRLVRVYGPAVVPDLLRAAAEGRSLDQALVARTGLSEVTHENLLREELRSLSGVLRDLSPQLFLILSLLMIGSFPFVFAARRRRRRELESRWEQDELRAAQPAGESAEAPFRG